MGEPERPNIVLILADDMGYGDFGCFNHGASHTPTLDQLVAGGVSLTQHYSAAPVCAPARASLLTGRYPHRTGAIDTLEARGLDRISLREVTIADVLRRAGYTTGLVGKWHNGAIDMRFHPNNRGFDEFAGFRGGWSDYYNWRLDRNGRQEPGDGRYLTDVLSDEAVGFVRRHRREHFFLHLAYNAPHFPFQAPEETTVPFREGGAFAGVVATIYAMIEVMDRGIARLLGALEDLQIADRTLVMFSSDNGPQFGDWQGESTERFNCGFAGSKGFVYEGGVRLPMVLRWPAGLPAPAVRHDLVHFTDWLPTLAGLAGAPLPAGRALDGIDVAPLLRGEGGRVLDRRFWQWNRYTPVGSCNAAMRDGDWKLVLPSIGELMGLVAGDGEADRRIKADPGAFPDIDRSRLPSPHFPSEPGPHLFNIRADPLERHDLAAAEPARARRMKADLEDWFEEVDRERRSIPAGDLR